MAHTGALLHPTPSRGQRCAGASKAPRRWEAFAGLYLQGRWPAAISNTRAATWISWSPPPPSFPESLHALRAMHARIRQRLAATRLRVSPPARCPLPAACHPPGAEHRRQLSWMATAAIDHPALGCANAASAWLWLRGRSIPYRRKICVAPTATRRRMVVATLPQPAALHQPRVPGLPR
jgi:hypothetical protein